MVVSKLHLVAATQPLSLKLVATAAQCDDGAMLLLLALIAK
jgi:hypothetical protein